MYFVSSVPAHRSATPNANASSTVPKARRLQLQLRDDWARNTLQAIRRNISSLAYLLNACAVDVYVIAAFVHVCIAPLCHADKADAVAKAVLAAGLFAQARAWKRLSQHDATKPRTMSNAPSNAPRKQRFTILTHNIWVHYFATPAKQFYELSRKIPYTLTVMCVLR